MMDSPAAPNAAKLLRQIAEKYEIKRFPPSRIAELSGVEVTQVSRWWNGAKRIGDRVNRDRLCEAFPDFASEIDRAIEDDLRISRERARQGRKGKPQSAPIDYKDELHEALADLTKDMLPEDRRTLGEALQRIAALGWPTCRRFIDLSLEKLEAAESDLRKFHAIPPPTVPPVTKRSG